MLDVDDALLDRFLEDDVSTSEAERVCRWLDDPHHLQRFAERAELHANLRRALRRRQIQEQALAEFREGGDGIQDETTEWSTGDTVPAAAPVTSVRPRSWGWVMLTLAAAALILIFVVPWTASRPLPVTTQVIATLAHQSHAQWAGDGLVEGNRVGPGVLDLEVGLVRLDFANGAKVTLQGPARYELISQNQTRLQSGVLTASVPDSATGFQVLTPAMDVIDHGTAFGVSVGFDGQTDVSVFEGEVEVLTSGTAASETGRRVTEGNAVRSHPADRAIEQVAYDPTPYEEAWPVTSGVLHANGLMRFVSPGPEFVPGRYEDSERILVFPERKGVILPEDITVDLVRPGQYRRLHRVSEEQLRAGRIVNSFLLQLNPIGQLKKKTVNKPRAIGQISFDRPIIGVIGGTARLAATDPLFGHPRGDYRKEARGIEPARPDEDSTDPGRDVVILSKDRRTLSVDLSAGSAVDQIRVLVRSAKRDRKEIASEPSKATDRDDPK